MSESIDFLSFSSLGNVASILGLLIAVVGFWITINGVRKSRSAAESAKIAADDARKIFLQVETITNFSTAVAVMEEIKRLHRAEAWGVVPDRYSSLRRMLTSILATEPMLSADHVGLIQSAMAQFRELERLVESKQKELHSHKLNEIVTAQLDKLDEILNFIKVKSNNR